MVGQIEGRERRERQARGAVEHDEVEVHAEVLHQPLHAAAHLHGDRVGLQVLLGMLQQQLSLQVLEPLRARQQADAARRHAGMGDVADVVHDIGGLVLGHLVEAVVEIVGDGAAGPAGALPADAADQHEGCVALRVEIHDQHAPPATMRPRHGPA